MTTFVSLLGFAYLATALLASGVAHLLRFQGFRALVRTHGVVSPRRSSLVATAGVCFELVAGAAALRYSVQESDGLLPAAVLFGVSAAIGAGFMLYIRRLLDAPPSAGCGCTPLGGPVTAASLLPGAALVTVAALALLATIARQSGPAAGVDLTGAAAALPRLAGVTVAATVMLVPASMPPPMSLGGSG
jgi:hypothetical protein